MKRSGGEVARALASHHGNLGSFRVGFTPGFSHVGIVLDDAACWRVFSWYSRFPRPCIPVPLHPSVSFHFFSGDGGHVRVPTGQPITRRELPRHHSPLDFFMQCWFRKGKSTTTALLALVDKITDAFNEDAVLFQKGFSVQEKSAVFRRRNWLLMTVGKWPEMKSDASCSSDTAEEKYVVDYLPYIVSACFPVPRHKKSVNNQKHEQCDPKRERKMPPGRRYVNCKPSARLRNFISDSAVAENAKLVQNCCARVNTAPEREPEFRSARILPGIALRVYPGRRVRWMTRARENGCLRRAVYTREKRWTLCIHRDLGRQFHLARQGGIVMPSPHSSGLGFLPTCSRRVTGSRPGASEAADFQFACRTGNNLSTSRRRMSVDSVSGERRSMLHLDGFISTWVHSKTDPLQSVVVKYYTVSGGVLFPKFRISGMGDPLAFGWYRYGLLNKRLAFDSRRGHAEIFRTRGNRGSCVWPSRFLGQSGARSGSLRSPDPHQLVNIEAQNPNQLSIRADEFEEVGQSHGRHALQTSPFRFFILGLPEE
ncbi:hypothetical protein PR048_024847 [Dryococelus australis]|uniref:Uncharacterized protein n=1 Tax=Dryococelus australis TaxID=614101 RepID=A0ABQ9GPN7_9NEOP|nr:hypothetical protein PR048_024847 [Dryococelus australis]